MDQGMMDDRMDIDDMDIDVMDMKQGKKYNREALNMLIGQSGRRDTAEKLIGNLDKHLLSIKKTITRDDAERFKNYFKNRAKECEVKTGSSSGCSAPSEDSDLRKLFRDVFVKRELTSRSKRNFTPLQFTVLLDLLNRMDRFGSLQFDVSDRVEDAEKSFEEKRSRRQEIESKRDLYSSKGVSRVTSDPPVHPVGIYRVKPAKSREEREARRFKDSRGTLDLQKFKHVVRDLIIDQMKLQYPKFADIASQSACQINKKTNVGDVILSGGQVFLMAYLDPRVFRDKGIVVWANTGFGKTCLVLAAASMIEMMPDKKVVFVTKKELRIEALKNVYDTNCFTPFVERIKSDPRFAREFNEVKTSGSSEERMRFLEGNTRNFHVMSYEQFSNLVRNEKSVWQSKGFSGKDPLKDTYVFLDEIHATNTGDLAKEERISDPREILAAFRKSDRISGENSVIRVFLSATPWGGKDAHILSAFDLIYNCLGKDAPPVFSDRKLFNRLYSQAKSAGKSKFSNFVQRVWQEFATISQTVLLYFDLTADPRQYPVIRSFKKVMYMLAPKQVEEMEKIVPASYTDLTPEQSRALLARSLTINLSKAGFRLERRNIEAVQDNIDLISPLAAALMEEVRKLDDRHVEERGHVGKHLIFLPVNSNNRGDSSHSLEEFYDVLVALGLRPVLVPMPDGSIVYDNTADVDYTWEDSASKWNGVGFLTTGKYHGKTMDQIKWGDKKLASLKDGLAAMKRVWNEREEIKQYGKEDEPKRGNNFGQRCRFLVVDEKLKAGWDSLDTVSVHDIGGASGSDFIQMIGRVLRSRGGQGLECVDGKWPIDVVQYSAVFPTIYTRGTAQKGRNAKETTASFQKRQRIQKQLRRFGVAASSFDSDEEGEDDWSSSDDDEEEEDNKLLSSYEARVRKSRKRIEGRIGKPSRSRGAPDIDLEQFLDSGFSLDKRYGDNSNDEEDEEDENYGNGKPKVAKRSYLISERVKRPLWLRGKRLFSEVISYQNIPPSDFGLGFDVDPSTPSDVVSRDTILTIGPLLKLVAMTNFMNAYLSGNINNPFAPPEKGSDLLAKTTPDSWKRYEFMKFVQETIRELPATKPGGIEVEDHKVELYKLPDDVVRDAARSVDNTRVPPENNDYEEEEEDDE